MRLAALTAIIILLDFTPIGYLITPGLEITFLSVPVIIGAIILDPKAGAILGAVFGLTSFLQCLGFGFYGGSAFGKVLFSINPLYTFIVCMIPRILMGWLVGLIFVGLRKIDRTKFVSFGVASISGALLNTIFFMTALILFFYGTEFVQGFVSDLGAKNVLTFTVLFVGINGLVEAAACFVLGTAISKALYNVVNKQKQ